jgi:hypothetical protein
MDDQSMTTIYADEVQPGDVIVYDGNVHQIVHVNHLDGWAWPVATDCTGWAIALSHRLIDVKRVVT